MTFDAPKSGDRDDGGNPFRKTGFMVAAGFLALVVVLAVVVVISQDNGKKATARPTPTTRPAQAVPVSGCRPTDTSQQVPSATPAGVTWNLYQGIALPSSKTAGPLVSDGDVARCYADTPAGALIAATQLASRYLVAPDWRAVTLQQVVPGAGRDAYMRIRAKVDSTSADPGAYAQYAGFKFVTYSPAEAVIETVTRTTDGAYGMTVLTVMWSGGDWKLQLQDDGNPSPPAQQVPDLDGFVTWGGV